MRIIIDWATNLVFIGDVTRLSIFGDDKMGASAERVNDSNYIEKTMRDTKFCVINGGTGNNPTIKLEMKSS